MLHRSAVSVVSLSVVGCELDKLWSFQSIIACLVKGTCSWTSAGEGTQSHIGQDEPYHQ